MQHSGPEAGMQERARRAAILAYYDEILHRRFLGSGKVTFLGGAEDLIDGPDHLATSRVSGETVRVDVRRRVVDATYLAPPADRSEVNAESDRGPYSPCRGRCIVLQVRPSHGSARRE